MAAAIAEDLNVVFCCCNMLHSIAHAAAFFLISQLLLLNRVETYHHCIHEVAPDQGINAARSSHQSAVGIKDGAAQRPLWGEKNTKSQCHKNRKIKLRNLEKLL